MKSNPIRCISLLTSVAALISPLAAQAQTIDYGSLQSLYGEPITTSATGTPQRAKDVPADMTILTADDIRRSGSRSIPEILRQVPGLDVMQTGSQSYDVGVRGYNQAFQPRLLVLLNGRQVFLDDYSRTDWNAIPVNIDEIRQIEVVKGPNAALFGNNAVGGVINIVTYNPMYDKVRVANVTGGTQETREASTTVTEKLDDWGGVKLTAGGLNNQEFDTGRTPTDASVTVDPSRRFASADGVFQLSPTIQGELETTYVKSQASSAAFTSGLYTESSQEISSFKGMLADQTDIGLIKLTSYWNHVLTGLEVPATPTSNLANDLYVVQLEDQFKIGAANTFRIAGEYRNNQFDLGIDQAVPQTDEIKYQTFSESAMWNWKIQKNLSLTNAVRVDERQENLTGTLGAFSNYTSGDYNQYVTGINVNSGLVYQATDIDTFRLTYGRGIQYPSFDESGVLITAALGGPALINIQGDPRVNPTVVTNYETDYDREIKSIFSTVRTGVFYTQNQALVAQVTSPGIFPVVSNVDVGENVGDSHAVGLEWGINGQHDGYRWGASYSLADVTDDPGVKSEIHYEKSAPQNSVKLNLGYTWGQWEFDGFGYYVSARESLIEPNGSAFPAQLITTDGYASLSARIGYNINDNIMLALSGTGLNQSYFDATAYPEIERQVFLSLTGRF